MYSSLPSIALLTIVGVMVFAATVLILGSGYGLLTGRQILLRRLRDTAGPDGELSPASIKLDDGFLEGLGRFLTPKEPKALDSLRLWLGRAGYRMPAAVRIYHMAKGVCTLSLAVFGAAVLPMIGGNIPIPVLVLILLGAVALGYFAPTLWVERRVELRRHQIEVGFPDVLDMILVCIEAGHSLDQSLARVARETQKKCAPLAEELLIIGNEMRAGKERAQVLRDFADRIGVNDISAFITIINQSDQYGVSIGDALRVYAAEMRNKRIMKAEEQANTMPVKVALGTILFTVPPVMLIMAGPSIIMLLRTFATMMSGHPNVP